MKKTKVCEYCGISFEWRKKWEDCWKEVRFCSDQCRKASTRKWAGKAEEAILELLGKGKPGQPHNPDEAARALVTDQNSREWQSALREVMCAARRLSRQNKLLITRKGKAISPDEVKGVVRLRTP